MTGTKLYLTIAGIALAVDVVGIGVAALIRRKLPASVKRITGLEGTEVRTGPLEVGQVG